MKLTGYYDTNNDIVVVRPVASITTKNIKISMQTALELSGKHNCLNLLFDIRKCTEGQSIVQAYDAMQSLEKLTGVSLRHKCAIVYDPEKYPTRRAEFIEDVVTNRSNPAFRMFTNIEKATEWLRGPHPSR